MTGAGAKMPTFGLVADIGGTNARFALTELQDSGLSEPRSWRVADFPTLADALSAYLAEVGPERQPRVAMLAVAASANGDQIRMTNCAWQFSVSEMKRKFGFDHLVAVNDFAANGWGVLDLPSSDLIPIGNKALQSRQGRFVVLGPGTGLGVGAVQRGASGMQVVETEGGHVDFAPLSDEEDAILLELRKRFGRVSYERLLSGPGLANIHAVVSATRGKAPEEVTRLALADDRNARRAVEIFCDILGSFAGDVALIHGAWDGVFLTGTMLHDMRETLNERFRRRFADKGRFSPTVAEIPTLLVAQPSLGLLGAASALRAHYSRQSTTY